MKRFFSILPLLLLSFFIFWGCSVNVALNPPSPSIAYSNKLQASILLYIEPDAYRHTENIRALGDQCSMVKYEIELGKSIDNVVLDALRTVFSDVSIVSSPPTAYDLADFDGLVRVSLDRADIDIELRELVLGMSARATCQLSLRLDFIGNEMTTIYVYSAQGTGIESDDVMSCSAAADVIGGAVDKAFGQISTDIAQSFYSSRQVSDYIQSLR